MSLRIYHNPRCSKSRQTLALLQEHGHTPEIVEYLTSPPTAGELAVVLGMLGMAPRDVMRKGEAVFKELNLSDDSLTDEQLIDAMVANPILIERPIVITASKAAIGRPPESVLDIL
jgi:arsenate reductase